MEGDNHHEGGEIKQDNIVAWIIIAFIAFGFARTFYRIFRVKRDGIEALGCVSRIEERDSTDPDGIPTTYYDYYVRYQTQDGWNLEAELSNPSNRLAFGDMIKIKYLPENPYTVVWVD